MEIIALYNEEGEPLHKGKSIADAHDDGDWHMAVHVWVFNPRTRQLLIQKRGPNMYSHANHWDISAAGHVPFGKTEIETALEEVKEELGLDVEADDLIHLATIKTGKNVGTEKKNNEFNPVFLIEKDIDIKDIQKQKEEVDQVKFVSVSEFKQMIDNPETLVVPHPEEYQILFSYLKKTS